MSRRLPVLARAVLSGAAMLLLFAPTMLEAQEGCRVHGKVQTRGGKAVAEAQVRLVPSVSSDSPVLRVTGDDGRWEARLPCESGFYVHVHAAGFSGLTAFVEGVGEDLVEPLVMPLSRATPIRGRVVDERGLAVSGARVVGLPMGPHAIEVDAFTGDDGSFRLPAPSSLYFGVRAEADGFTPALFGEPVKPGRAEPLELVLTRARAVSGTVFLERRGVPEVEVSVEPGGHLTRTNREGEFSLEGLAPQPYRLTARWDDLLSQTLTVDLREDAIGGLELHLEPTSMLFVRVLGREGQPVEGAEVVLESALVRSLGGWAPRDADDDTETVLSPEGEDLAVTDDTGEAILHRVRAGEQTLQASAPGYATARATAKVPPGMSATVVVRLVEGHPLEVRVKGGDASAPRTVVAERIEKGSYVVQAYAEVDRRGRAAFEDLAEAHHRLLLRDGQQLVSVVVGVPAAEPVILEVPAPVTLKGRVVTARGAAATPSRVRAYKATETTRMEAEVGIDDRGRFVFENLEPGRWTLLLRSRKWALASPVEVDPAGGPVKLVAGPAVSLGGKVVGPRGEPRWKARVTLLLDSDRKVELAQATTGPDGTFEVTGLPTVRLRLRVESKGAVTERSVDLPHEGRVQLVIGDRGSTAVMD